MNNTINFQFIMETLDVSMDNLLDLSVREILDLQEQAEEAYMRKTWEGRVADPEYREYALSFLQGAEYLRRFFSEDEIVEACARYLSKEDLAVHKDGQMVNLDLLEEALPWLEDYDVRVYSLSERDDRVYVTVPDKDRSRTLQCSYAALLGGSASSAILRGVNPETLASGPVQEFLAKASGM
jgi:hypothetical protein